MTEKKHEFQCTECGGDATIAYCAETIKRGKHKGEERESWGGLVKPGERLCIICGRKRGIKFF
jgi:hypothetical protein